MPAENQIVDAPEEPLSRSAPLARELASACCAPECAAYHGLWQYLRLAGMGKTMSGLSRHYIDATRQCAAQWDAAVTSAPRRVLISGCADYSALAHVLHACADQRYQPHVTALDLCETPLLMSRWYARRHGAEIDTVQANMLEFRDTDGFDLILTSSFLGYFSPAQRPRLFVNYADNLRPGGMMIFANRLREQVEDTRVSFSAQQASVFADRVAQLAERLPAHARPEAKELHAMALDYARFMTSWPVNNADSLRALADAAGLEWLQGQVIRPPALQRQLSGPTVGDGAEYIFVRLRKPRVITDFSS